MTKSVPRHTDALSGDASTRASDAKKQGRRLPYVPISLRNFSSPCSGRTEPVPHLGPPMAPRRTASAAFAAESVSSVRGVPWASMEHWRERGLLDVVQER